MARGFDTTFGGGANDLIATGSFALQALSTISCWIWINGAGGGSAGRLLERTSSNCRINFNGSVSQLSVEYPFTSNPGQWGFTAPATGAWHHLAITYNGSSSGNTPAVYADGSTVSTSVIGAPSGSFNVISEANGIGNRSALGRVFDGMIAEFAIWNNSVLTASEIGALAKGVPALFIRPASLSLYLPLNGAQSGEADWGPSHLTQTVSGAKAQNHAPVSFWMPASPSLPQTVPVTPPWRRPGLTYRRTA